MCEVHKSLKRQQMNYCHFASVKKVLIKPVTITLSVCMLWCRLYIWAGYEHSLSLPRHPRNTLLLTSSLYCMWQCQTGRWVGHPTTSDIQPSEMQGHGFCPVVFISLKCAAKMVAGCLSQLGQMLSPRRPYDFSWYNFLGNARHCRLDTANSSVP